MAISATNVNVAVLGNQNRTIVRQGSLACTWATILDANGPATANNSGSVITNPTTQVTTATTHILKLDADGASPAMGTILLLSLGYNASLVVTTNPVVQVFGRAGSSDRWQLLVNNAGGLTGTITADTTNDVTDGTLKYTTPHQQYNAWDVLGCAEILVAVVTALAGTGTVNTSILQAKVI